MSESKNKPKVSEKELPFDQQPTFIYGGPFIKHQKADQFIETTAPFNMILSGAFSRSMAYESLKDRTPVTLTLIIDVLSKMGHTKAVAILSKLKSDLVTNKQMQRFTLDSKEMADWNQCLLDSACSGGPFYFTAPWLLTECYVYRRAYEALELTGVENVDYFAEKKAKSFEDNVQAMCVVAEAVAKMLAEPADKARSKAELVLLLKLCMWSNKCDLSLSAGSDLAKIEDPVELVAAWDKEYLLVDDSGKAAEYIADKGPALLKQLAEADEKKNQDGADPDKPKPEKLEPPEVTFSCPGQVVNQEECILDVICDNSGYELFMDLCVGYYLIKRALVQKVRYHVKPIPWFVSDAMKKDVTYVANGCAQASFSGEVPVAKDKNSPPDAPDTRRVTSADLRAMGAAITDYIAKGIFIIETDPFWVSPRPYHQMKKSAEHLYRKLQLSLCVLVKGDLNYRKLMAERAWVPTDSFEACLQGFNPCPLIALRTVKSEIVCGLPKGKYSELINKNDKWMRTGDYGLIHFTAKKDPIKPSEMPCELWGSRCDGCSCKP